jgi:hypothetical protein
MYYSETTVQNLVRVLDEQVTRFQFRKKNGSLRTALGTRNEILIPKIDAPRLLDDVSTKSVVFWDLEERAFRSFSKEAEVAVL